VKDTSSIDKEIARMLKQMRKAMPEVKRQVKVYEKSLAAAKVRNPASAKNG